MLLRLAALFLAALSLPAAATVTVLNSPLPLHAPINGFFPPLQVRVTDASGAVQAGVQVKFSLPRTLAIDNSNECIGEPGFTCTRITDATGVATLDTVHAPRAGNTFISISALQWPAPDFGNARVEVIADPFVSPATLSVVSGNNQVTLIGSRYLQPFVVQARTAGGAPLANVDVTFVAQGGVAGGNFPNVFPIGDVSTFTARTDANGVAVSADFTAGWGLAGGYINVELPNAGMISTTVFDFRNVNAQGGIDLKLQNMWWRGPEENGWGLSVVQHRDRLFNVLYAYDANGNPTWWVQPDGRWFAGVGSSYRGFIFSPRGSPYFRYDASFFRPGSGAGDFDVRFNGPEHGSLIANFNGLQVTKSIGLLDFNAGNDAPFDVGDMWWGGVDQNGWGIAILQQPGGLFMVWFTYDDNGEPIWFVMPTGTWSGGALTGGFRYSGAIYRTHGSDFTNYDRSRFTVTQAGTFALTFTDDQTAAFTYTIGTNTGTLNLVRQPF